MRIHTGLTPREIYAMLTDLPGVTFDRFEVKGSRSHDRAFDVILSGTSGRRHNGGNSGAAWGYAATWDEWGIFLGRVFRADPEAKATYYAGKQDFDRRTCHRFSEAFTVADQHRQHKWETFTFDLAQCKCGAGLKR